MPERIATNLRRDIEGIMMHVGLLARVYSRAKSVESLKQKLEKEPDKYSTAPGRKKVQDIIGIRIVLYFKDDISVVKSVLSSAFDIVEVVEDKMKDSVFGPERLNIVVQLSDEYAREVGVLFRDKPVDTTAEIQIRTTLSEGWHEVEHDLRYKCKDDWEAEDDLSRTLNGIYATLETCDWAMLRLFDDLAWRHYKKKSWMPMMRCKFRLRFQQNPLRPELVSLLNEDTKLAKDIFRTNRDLFLNKIVKIKKPFPTTFDNVIYLVNHFSIRSERIEELVPSFLMNRLLAQSRE